MRHINSAARKIFACAATLVTALCASGGAAAQDYPSRQITLIFPFAAGGGGDTGARVIAAELAKLLGQPVVVENRAGGSGSLGFAALRTSKPDGYTISF